MTARKALPATGTAIVTGVFEELALASPLARDLAGSMSASTKRSYATDIADFDAWRSSDDRQWHDPNLIADYFHFLAQSGAKWSTIERRRTALAKLIEILVEIGRLDVERNPLDTLRVSAALTSIRREIGTDSTSPEPLFGDQLIETLLSIDAGTLAGRRDWALLLVGWYGALRRSELARIRRGDLVVSNDGLIVNLDRTKAAQDHAVSVTVVRHSGRFCPVAALERWLVDLDAHDVDDSVWLRITKGDRPAVGSPAMSDWSVNQLVQRRVLAAGVANAADMSAHSIRHGFISEARRRGLDEADVMRHARIKSLEVFRRYDHLAGQWHRNPTAAVVL